MERAGVPLSGIVGQSGDFSFTHVLQDVEAALRFLRRPAVARDLRVDTRQLVLAGHSMGGFAALYVGARHPELRGVASLAGFDFGAVAAATSDDGARVWVDRFREALPPLAGTTAEALVQEFLARGDAWALSRSAPAYGERTVLLVAAEHDGVAPPDLHHTPLVAAFEAAGARLDVVRLPGDHNFSARRVTLARTLVDWLETLVQSAAVSESRRPPVGVSATTPSADWASR